MAVSGGSLDCGVWVHARQENRGQARVYESYVLGFLDGIAVGEDREFWSGKARTVSRDAAYLWVDNYCRSNPLSMVVTAVFKLFKESAKN